MEFLYAINPFSGKPILQINKHIGYDEEDGQGIDGIQFSREFFELDGLSPELITTYVNTLGGDVKQGFDIFNCIVSANSPTYTVYQGFGYSTGGWCGMGADKVDAYDYSTWMCHLPYNPDNPSESSPFLNMVAHSIATIISEKSGKNGKPKKTYNDILDMMRTKTYYTAEDMYNAGLIDNVLTSSGNVKVFNSEDSKKTYKEYQRVFNKFIEDNYKTNKIMAFEKVLNKLNLAEGSGEDSILAAIARMENDLNAANKEKDALDAKLKALNDSQEENQKKMLEVQNAKNQIELDAKNKQAELDKIKNDMDMMEAENKVMKEEKEKALNAAKEQEIANKKEKASNLVKQYVGVKIKAEDEAAINVWENMAVDNYDNTKVLLEALPTSFKAPVTIPTGAAVEKDNSPLGYYMAKNKEKYEQTEKNKKALLAAIEASK